MQRQLPDSVERSAFTFSSAGRRPAHLPALAGCPAHVGARPDCDLDLVRRTIPRSSRSPMPVGCGH